ncbi:hypothetical protein [Leptothoe sp. PORK10 BA2]|uniref:hypothetical protein n=1 Tax=Leptothoe sp. PORK10 BA2 TaxID=3110254 RepID=UPI002B20BFB8|nr:hypothetical protein [Leptothoe sp. PORK10 BA2]MEA5465787.1 hypothetical protein [Leptothoe sp. PORK10 BA2]
MLAKRVRLGLLTPTQVSHRHQKLGLFISLLFALVYGLMATQQAFSTPYVIQEDARHYLFWMDRFANPKAFPNDLIADYLQSIAPMGYKFFFQIASQLTTLEPQTIAKLLPVILGTITAGFFYQLTLTVFPLPLTGVIASVMLSQSMWCAQDVSSGSPRGFVMPLLVPLLLCFMRQQWWLSLFCLGLLALIYPPVALVTGTLYVAHAIRFSSIGQARQFNQIVDPDKLWLAGWAIFIVALGILPSYFSSQGFGPTVTMAQAHTLPEFQPGGRHPFFRDNFLYYWLGWLSSHSGLFKRSMFTPITMLAALFIWPMYLNKRRFGLLQAIRPTWRLFIKLTIVSLFWFVMAYVIAFKLFMPVRYTGYSFLVMVPILSAIAWTAILDWSCGYFAQRPRWQTLGLPLVLLTIGLPLFFYYPLLINNFPKPNNVVGTQAAIYEYLQAQPQETMVVSVDTEANNIPSFGKRSVLMAPEYGNAFHLGYYYPMKKSASALLKAHYTNDPALVRQFIEQYGVSLWLVHRQAFDPQYLRDQKYWTNNYQALTAEMLTQLQQGQTPMLQGAVDNCTRLETDQFWLLESSCILQQAGR